jgi:hypothetical protein
MASFRTKLKAVRHAVHEGAKPFAAMPVYRSSVPKRSKRTVDNPSRIERRPLKSPSCSPSSQDAFRERTTGIGSPSPSTFHTGRLNDKPITLPTEMIHFTTAFSTSSWASRLAFGSWMSTPAYGFAITSWVCARRKSSGGNRTPACGNSGNTNPGYQQRSPIWP